MLFSCTCLNTSALPPIYFCENRLFPRVCSFLSRVLCFLINQIYSCHNDRPPYSLQNVIMFDTLTATVWIIQVYNYIDIQK